MDRGASLPLEIGDWVLLLGNRLGRIIDRDSEDLGFYYQVDVCLEPDDWYVSWFTRDMLIQTTPTDDDIVLWTARYLGT